MLFYCVIEVSCLFGTEMPYRTVNKLQIGFNCPFAYFFDGFGIADSLNLFVCTESKINFIGICNGFLRKLFTDKLGKVTADLTAQRKLTVGKCTRP